MSEEKMIEIINETIKALRTPLPFIYSNVEKAEALERTFRFIQQRKRKE